MIIELRDSVGSETDFECQVRPELEHEAARLIKPVTISGKVRFDGIRAEMNGAIAGMIECDCARCLKPIDVDLDFRFHDVFVTPEEFGRDPESEVAPEELDVDVFDGEHIDLEDVVREQILLFLPEQVFCREDCRGLCPTCGADLNIAGCDCSRDEVDPRWAGLKNLKF